MHGVNFHSSCLPDGKYASLKIEKTLSFYVYCCSKIRVGIKIEARILNKAFVAPSQLSRQFIVPDTFDFIGNCYWPHHFLGR